MSINLWEKNIPLYDEKLSENEENKGTPTITPYFVNEDIERGAVIIFPGGGYGMRADHEGEPIAKWLNSIGIHAFVVDYRVSPYKHPAMIIDAQRAIRHVRHFAKAHKIGNIATLGFSAGGHLAGSTATLFNEEFLPSTYEKDSIDKESARPDASILCYPVIALTEEFGHIGSGKNLVGTDTKLQEKLSCHNNVTENTPPIFMWHTSEDGTVNVTNSLIFGEKLKENNVLFELHVFPFGGHGIGLGTDNELAKQWTGLCGNWLKVLGF